MFRQRIPFTQMAFAAVLGVAGGIYIYRPYYEAAPRTRGQQDQDQDPPKQKDTSAN